MFVTCSVCSANFDTNKLLKEHMDVVHMMRYACLVCTQLFSDLETFGMHTSEHLSTKAETDVHSDSDATVVDEDQSPTGGVFEPAGNSLDSQTRNSPARSINSGYSLRSQPARLPLPQIRVPVCSPTSCLTSSFPRRMLSDSLQHTAVCLQAAVRALSLDFSCWQTTDIDCAVQNGSALADLFMGGDRQRLFPLDEFPSVFYDGFHAVSLRLLFSLSQSRTMKKTEVASPAFVRIVQQSLDFSERVLFTVLQHTMMLAVQNDMYYCVSPNVTASHGCINRESGIYKVSLHSFPGIDLLCAHLVDFLQQSHNIVRFDCTPFSVSYVNEDNIIDSVDKLAEVSEELAECNTGKNVRGKPRCGKSAARKSRNQKTQKGNCYDSNSETASKAPEIVGERDNKSSEPIAGILTVCERFEIDTKTEITDASLQPSTKVKRVYRYHRDLDYKRTVLERKKEQYRARLADPTFAERKKRALEKKKERYHAHITDPEFREKLRHEAAMRRHWRNVGFHEKSSESIIGKVSTAPVHDQTATMELIGGVASSNSHVEKVQRSDRYHTDPDYRKMVLERRKSRWEKQKNDEKYKCQVNEANRKRSFLRAEKLRNEQIGALRAKLVELKSLEVSGLQDSGDNKSSAAKNVAFVEQEIARLIGYASKHTTKGCVRCNECGKWLSSASRLAYHMSVHTNDTEKPYLCSLCDKHFLTPRHLRIHMKIHVGDKRFNCQECGKQFRTQTELDRHLIVHSSEKPHRCAVCKKSFKHLSNLRLHERLHTGEKPFTCQYCDKRFAISATMMQHIASKHRCDQPVLCETCGAQLANRNDLRTHLRTQHSMKSFQCGICQKDFTIKKYLYNHMATHSDRTFVCEACGAKYRQANKLRQHVERCHNKKKDDLVKISAEVENHDSTWNGEHVVCDIQSTKFIHSDRQICDKCGQHCRNMTLHRIQHHSPQQCSACQMQFISFAELYRHQLYECLEMTYVCDKCGRRFREPLNLRRHVDGCLLANRSRKIPQRDCICEICGKGFPNPSALMIHNRSHTGEKPYVCQICNRRFAHTWHLQVHRQRTHDREAHFECVDCREHFVYPKQLKRHAEMGFCSATNPLPDVQVSIAEDNSNGART